MRELEKVRRVIEKQLPGAPHETLLVLDATTGQNGLRQAQVFREAVDVTGVVLTKLDGTAKGGIVIAIHEELGIPIKLVGVGEQLEDLRPFDADEFARALFGGDGPPTDAAPAWRCRLETAASDRARVHDRRRRSSSPRCSATHACSGGNRCRGRTRRRPSLHRPGASRAISADGMARVRRRAARRPAA